MSLGREMCEKAFRKEGLNFHALLKSDTMMEIAGQFGFKAIDDLIVSVGYGKITALQLVRKFEPRSDEKETHESLLGKIIGRVRKKKAASGVMVKGIDDILVRFGKCCNPVPGDPITGYITRGFGVTVHRSNCVNALKMSPERRIDVQWNEDSSETFPVKLRISSFDRVGLLAAIAMSISKQSANILSLNTKTRDNGTVDSLIVIAVENTGHLERVLSSLKKIKYVQEVTRMD